MTKSSTTKSLFPKALNAHNLGILLAIMCIAVVIAQVPEFLRFSQCIDAKSGACEASVGFPLFLLLMTIIPLGLFVIKWVKKIPWSEIGLGKPTGGKKQTVALLMIGLLLILLVNLGITLLARRIPVLGEEQFNFGNNPSLHSILPFAIFAIALAPLSEELLFRGFEFSILGRRFGLVTAAIISSITFGVAHGQIAPAIVTSLFGLYLCYMFTKTQSLWPGILLHTINNTLAVLALLLIK